MKPDYSEEELLKAKRQISSILHKLRETVRTLREKENADRLKSQITLAERRIQALEIANTLIEKARGWRIWRLAEHPEMAEEAATLGRERPYLVTDLVGFYENAAGSTSAR